MNVRNSFPALRGNCVADKEARFLFNAETFQGFLVGLRDSSDDPKLEKGVLISAHGAVRELAATVSEFNPFARITVESGIWRSNQPREIPQRVVGLEGAIRTFLVEELGNSDTDRSSFLSEDEKTVIDAMTTALVLFESALSDRLRKSDFSGMLTEAVASVVSKVVEWYGKTFRPEPKDLVSIKSWADAFERSVPEILIATAPESEKFSHSELIDRFLAHAISHLRKRGVAEFPEYKLEQHLAEASIIKIEAQ